MSQKAYTSLIYLEMTYLLLWGILKPMGLLSRHKKVKAESEAYYKTIGQVKCPFFNKEVIFNSDGFNHLQFSDGSERPKTQQMNKFNLLPLAPKIISVAGTVQEYRKQWGKVGRKKANGFQETKEMEYWGLIAIIYHENENIKVRVILRRVGDGNVTFWSIMRDARIREKDTYHLASGDISED